MMLNKILDLFFNQQNELLFNMHFSIFVFFFLDCLMCLEDFRQLLKYFSIGLQFYYHVINMLSTWDGLVSTTSLRV